MNVFSIPTDLGTEDFKIGTMAEVILKRIPDTKITDLTHAIPPQDIIELSVANSAHTIGYVFQSLTQMLFAHSKRRTSLWA